LNNELSPSQRTFPDLLLDRLRDEQTSGFGRAAPVHAIGCQILQIHLDLGSDCDGHGDRIEVVRGARHGLKPGINAI